MSPTPLPHPSNQRDLTRFVQVFDEALDPDFCARLLESFDQLARFHSRNGRGVMKQLQASAWTELNLGKVANKSLQQFFQEQAATFLTEYNNNAPMAIPVPLRPRMEDLRIKRYIVEEGDRFEPHFDALDYTCNRYMVFLWYLNDVADGGETEFCNLDLRIAARAGRLLMFPPYWMFQHAGLPPRSNDKYIISTYMLF
jgi:prolyl 4-hydroxylase